MKGFVKSVLALCIVFTLAIGFMPGTAQAVQYGEAQQGVAYTIERGEWAQLKLTIIKPTIVTFKIETLQPGDPASRYYAYLHLKNRESDYVPTVQYDHVIYIGDNTQAYPSSRLVVYKLLPGVFDVTLEGARTTIRGLRASVTLTSKTYPVQDAEPNDTERQAKSLSFGKTMRGNIGYSGITVVDGDDADYYKFATKQNRTKVTLTGRNLNAMCKYGVNAEIITYDKKRSSWNYKKFTVASNNKDSFSKAITIPFAGTHYVRITGGMNEYEFTLYKGDVTKVTGVALDKRTASVKRGKTLTLHANVKPASAKNRAVTWKSSNRKIATVTRDGVVKGIKKGKVTITVTTRDGRKTAKCLVTVR